MSSTVQYKRTLRGSVGAGVGALFNGNGRRYYILEHKDASKYHKAGESQKIIIDQIELGRDGHCQVQFDESFATVSRRHAAIIKDGDKWKLVQLSKTNTTFLNGRPIAAEWYLENGDEIQLSVNGPRLGFIVPAGKQSLVSSIRMTERLELFRKQALKPYKTALVAMAIILAIIGAGGGYKMYGLHQDNLKNKEKIAAITIENDSLKNTIEESNKTIAQNKKEIGNLFNAIKNIKRGNSPKRQHPTPTPAKLDNVSDDVFFIGLKGYTVQIPGASSSIYVEVGDEVADEKIKFMSGTGFLLNDGTFVTARHVVEPWYFGSSNLDAYFNAAATSGGKIVGHFYAVSSKYSFEFTTTQFHCNRSKDKIGKEGEISYRIADQGDTDYAYCRVNSYGALAYDSSLSRNLKTGEKLFIYGYPLGIGGNTGNPKPSYSSAEVARDGLVEDGYIMTTATGFEHGNSGGPVLVEKDGKKIVIGIVSAGAGRSTGFVVPISVIK